MATINVLDALNYLLLGAEYFQIVFSKEQMEKIKQHSDQNIQEQQTRIEQLNMLAKTSKEGTQP